MNIVNGFLTIPGQIQIDLNLGTPGIRDTEDGYLVELPDMTTTITLKRIEEGYAGRLESKGMGASLLFTVKNIEAFFAALRG